MTEYKILTKKAFSKDTHLLDDINNEARNGWKAISFGYTQHGAIVKAVLERTK